MSNTIDQDISGGNQENAKEFQVIEDFNGNLVHMPNPTAVDQTFMVVALDDATPRTLKFLEENGPYCILKARSYDSNEDEFLILLRSAEKTTASWIPEKHVFLMTEI